MKATADAILESAFASPVPLLYEAYPSRRWFRADDLPRGYAGEAYPADDPRCVAAIMEDLTDGWTLESPEQIAALAE